MNMDTIEPNQQPPSMDQALDLSVKNLIPSSISNGLVSESQLTLIPPRTPPHPQISITDEEGEVTAMSWNAYAHLSGKIPPCFHRSSVGLENLQNHLLSSSGGSCAPQLCKTSSGSIEVQLSSNCSQLTVTEIFSLIKQSIDTKGLSTMDDTVSALFLGQPDEDIHIAVEVSPPTGPQGRKGLKIRRISGDYVRYDRICNDLIACINI